MTISKKRGLGLTALVVLAFALRALFTVYGASAYYHLPAPACYSFSDATTYMWSAENLINSGQYTFDYLEPDAAFGRLPGYPLFYGLHYAVFGPGRAIYATAWSQVVLDSLTVLLVFAIICRLAPASRFASWVGALLYATYPFIIFWTPILYTELLSTEVALLLVYAMLRYTGTRWAAFRLGLLAAVALFMREYLGLFLPIAMLWVVWAHGGLSRRRAWEAAVLVGMGFGALYIGWPIRNYVEYHRLVLLKPKTAGYASYKEDFDDYRNWLQCWTNDENPWIEQVSKRTGPVAFPPSVFANAHEQTRAQELVALARRCGSSFYMHREASNSTIYGRRRGKPVAFRHTEGAYRAHAGNEDEIEERSIYAVYRDTAFMMHDSTYLFYRNHNCNAAISSGFTQLKASYYRRNQVAYWLNVPSKNLIKAFFKSSTAVPVSGGIRALALRGLFGYRTLLLLLGVAGLFLYRKERDLWPVAIYSGAIVLFICFIMRGLEMRYLLQADVLMLLPAALVLGRLTDRLWARRFRPTHAPLSPIS